MSLLQVKYGFYLLSSNKISCIKDWSLRIVGRGGWELGRSKWGGGGGRSLHLEPSQRGGSINFELAKGGGASYL